MNVMLPRTIDRPDAASYDLSRTIGRLAIRALYTELSLYPKPGLVSPIDNGAHSDMTMATFMRSLFSLRSYFPEIAFAGSRESGFPALQRLGIDAERRMLVATGGINTHRGAIFNLGLLAAAAGLHLTNGTSLRGEDICMSVSQMWGSDILGYHKAETNGSLAIAKHGGGGAREQAASGYAVLRELSLPVFRDTLHRTGSRSSAALQTIFAIMSSLNDTNILHRAGSDGLDFARQQASAFLSSGGVHAPDHVSRAVDIHQAFCARRISPGGAADLLTCTVFLHDMETFS